MPFRAFTQVIPGSTMYPTFSSGPSGFTRFSTRLYSLSGLTSQFCPATLVLAHLLRRAVARGLGGAEETGFGFVPAYRSLGMRVNMMNQFLSMMLDGQCYALPLAAVARVVRAVEITPLPNAPAVVLGLISVQGQIVPVVNLRQRFHLPEREVAPGDQMVIARTSKRTLALVVDAVGSVIVCADAEIVAVEQLVGRLAHIAGVAQIKDGIVLIHDLEKFLALDEERALDEALQAGSLKQ